MALGENILTISEAVERYMAISGNNSPSFKAQYLIRGVEVWKDLKDNILKTPSHKWVRVDKSSLPFKAELPKCASLFISVGAINKCDEYVAFTRHQNMHTVPYKEVEQCSCGDDLKNCLESYKEKTEDVVIETACSQRIDLNDEAGKSRFYVGYIDYFNPNTNAISKKTSNITANESNNSIGTVLTLNSFIVNGVEYVPSPVQSLTTSFYDVMDLYYSLNVPDVIFKVVSARNYLNLSELEWNTTGFANVGWIIMIAPPGTTVLVNGIFADINQISPIVPLQINNQAVSESEIFDKWTIYPSISDIVATFDTPDGEQEIAMDDLPTGWTFSPSLYRITKPCYDGYVIQSATLYDIPISFVADNISVSEILKKTTKTKVYSNGDVYIETITPMAVLNSIGGFSRIEMVTDSELICKLDVKPCGCIDVSETNLSTIGTCMDSIFENCKAICQNVFTQPNEESLTRSDSGYFKYEEGSNWVYLYGDVPNQVLLNFKSNGEVEENMPEYCLNAFILGMDFYNSRYSRTMNRFDKAQARQDYWAAKNQLKEMLPRNRLLVSHWDNNRIGIFVKW